MKANLAKLLGSACFLVIVARAGTAEAAEPMSYVVRAHVRVAESIIAGTVWTQVRVAEGEGAVRFWLLADRLAVRPSVLDQINARWLFPGEVDLGSMVIQAVSVDDQPCEGRIENLPVGTERGRDFTGSDLVVPVTPGASRVVQIAIDFTVQLPARFGRLGIVDDRVTLSAPWYPLVVGDGDTWRYRVPHRVTVEADAARSVLVGGRLTQPGSERMVRGAFAPVLMAPSLHHVAGDAGGHAFDVVSPYELYRRNPPEAEGLERLEDVIAVDRVALIDGAVADVLATLEHVGLGAHARTPLTVAFVPSRTELAATAPGVVLVSDRIFQIFPIDLTREFQLRAFRRALFRALLSPLVDATEQPRDRPWAEDLRATFLTDVDVARRDGQVRTPRELIGFAAFHPSVDQLLYAPPDFFRWCLLRYRRRSRPVSRSPGCCSPAVRGGATVAGKGSRHPGRDRVFRFYGGPYVRFSVCSECASSRWTRHPHNR